MKAELISTGTELLLGQTPNTNADYLSQKLSALGINVYYHTTVGDNAATLAEVIESALKRVDLVITTGGLGPTVDDLTKQTVCKVLGVEQELHPDSLKRIEELFATMGLDMPESNVKQAYFPHGSKVVSNHLGTAPGAIVEHNDKIVVILPGPPFEMKPMFEESVEPYLRSKAGTAPEVVRTRVLKVFGMSESAVEEMLGEVLNSPPGTTIAFLAKQAEINVRLSVTGVETGRAQELLDELESQIRAKLGDRIFAVDNEDMALVVGELLTYRRITMATAESCTGGLIGGKLTSISGSSAYYVGGFNTYSNDLKVKLLGVSEKTLDTHGAVSAETAREMAQGARIRTGADIAISVTGIAGPGGGSAEKPVGLVYAGLATPEGCEAVKFNFFGDREAIRALTVNGALDRARLYLLQRQQ